MKLLGVDYGRKNIGLAIAESSLAAPLKVVGVESLEDAVEKVESAFAEASMDKQVEEVVVGISEGEMAKETRSFAHKLRKKLNIPIKFQDETLSSIDSQKLSFEAGIKRKKRKSLEHAYSATIILQNYLDKPNL